MKRPLQAKRARSSAAGFSLVEVTLALGISAFALVSCLGLFSVGLNSFQNAIDTGVQTQVAQVLLGSVRQSDFSRLSEFQDQVRYYDDQGSEVREADKIAALNYIYSARVKIQPASALPSAVTAVERDKLAAVAITITNRTASQSQFRFSTIIADNGL